MGTDRNSAITANQIKNDTLTEAELSTTNEPTDGYILSYDETTGKFTWSAPASGTPGGSDTEVQFNDDGSFAGDSAFVWNKTNNTLIISSSENQTRLEIDNDGTDHGLYLHQDGVLASGKHALYVHSNAVQVSSKLVRFHQDNASSTQNVFEVENDGTGAAIEIDQNGNGVGLYINNTGTKHGLHISQDYTLTASYYGFYVYSNIAQTNSALARVRQNHNSSTASAFEVQMIGTGNAVFIDHGYALASGKHALYVLGTGVNVNADSALVKIKQNSVSATEPSLEIKHNGQEAALEIYADHASASHIRLTGDPSNSTPVDGDLWYDGSHLYFRDNTTTVDLLLNNIVSGQTIQTVCEQTNTVSSHSTTIPADDTVPTSSEGEQILSVSITPKNSSNILYIEVLVNFGLSTDALGTITLFQDSGSSAIAVASKSVYGYADKIHQVKLIYKMTAGTTSSTTFKVRFGSSSGTGYLNQFSDGTNYSNKVYSNITIKEVKF